MVRHSNGCEAHARTAGRAATHVIDPLVLQAGRPPAVKSVFRARPEQQGPAVVTGFVDKSGFLAADVHSPAQRAYLRKEGDVALQLPEGPGGDLEALHLPGITGQDGRLPQCRIISRDFAEVFITQLQREPAVDLIASEQPAARGSVPAGSCLRFTGVVTVDPASPG